MEVLPEADCEEDATITYDEEEGVRELKSRLSSIPTTPTVTHIAKPIPQVDLSNCPSSYKENSSQEKLMLAMAENFRQQYALLYPDNKVLLLCPVNECGVQKFVSTTLRRTLLPYPELYYWEGCASFVSDYLSLELLDPPFELPKQLSSPTWVLQTRRGTCFDFSSVLCSLLLGAGYNAYCVSGYATKEMCLLDQSREECPLLQTQIQGKTEEPKKILRKYSVKPPRDLDSSFEKRQEEKRQTEAEEAALKEQLEAERLQKEKERPPPDPLLGLRVHSWVLVLSGNREEPENFFIDPLTDMEMRFPGGMKVVQYRKAKLEKFAPHHQIDGLVTRLTIYKDLDCTQTSTVKEWFSHRGDCLDEREFHTDSNVTSDYFRPGRRDALRCHRYVTLVPETERQMDFYSHTHTDGLARRIEKPFEMTETFEDRLDFLFYRHVVYGKQVKVIRAGEAFEQRPLMRVEERFHRDPSKPASKDVAERIFKMSDRRIKVTYHLEDDRITPSWLNFMKPKEAADSQKAQAFTPQMVSGFQVDRFAKPYKNLQLYEMLVELMKDEYNIELGIRDSEKEVKAILSLRKKEESNTDLLISIYNTRRNKMAHQHMEEKERMAKEKKQRQKEKELDLLAPFQARLGLPEVLTHQEALQLETECLTEFKQLLDNKTSSIQSRIEKETEELQKKQQWFQKNQLNLTSKDEEDYQAYCSEAKFRIHILKMRLSRHKERGPQKTLALEENLKRHPKLASYSL
ncbi:dynein regulatory complex subunit [Pimephales promelas]|nr:dynein regulatory complex subunit [Pimephales promelas]